MKPKKVCSWTGCILHWFFFNLITLKNVKKFHFFSHIIFSYDRDYKYIQYTCFLEIQLHLNWLPYVSFCFVDPALINNVNTHKNWCLSNKHKLDLFCQRILQMGYRFRNIYSIKVLKRCIKKSINSKWLRI